VCDERVAVAVEVDALRFVVHQHGTGFCHRGTRTCWGTAMGLDGLAARIAAAAAGNDAGSYTRKLLASPDWLRSKLVEEASELAAAGLPAEVAAEAADLFYFATVALSRANVPLAAVEAELDRRALAVTRRPGLAKREAEAG
jgi:phosphoribosyl-ATP pyrophosphohydrolase/phosphoribosyl-AMP cyclohydrolase/histidinol dehydrogenase